MKTQVNSIFTLLACSLFIGACSDIPVPKPKGYFRIDLPEKRYSVFIDTNILDGIIPLTFEYPVYGKVTAGTGYSAAPGWFNIDFPSFRASIYLTYRKVNNDLEVLMEETYRMNVKNHISKADAINEQIFSNPGDRVYGILYDLRGNTATALQFFVTDSINHFLRGSLYFMAEPNPDSLAPVNEFFRDDIVHLIETLKWRQN